MTLLQGLILGIIEGITEFLPISSTAHLILTSKLLGLVETEFLKSFEISIQLGAILAVVFVYRKKIFKKNLELFKKIATAFLPTALIGFVLYKVVKSFFMGNIILMSSALLIGGIILILFETFTKNKEKLKGELDLSKVSYKQSFIIGLCQALAVIPGVSRSAATIIGGMSLGINRKTIVEFTFLLAIPTMLAATGYDFLKSFSSFDSSVLLPWFIGFIASFLTALVSIKWLLKFINNNNFIIFGIYRIVVGLLILLYFI